MEYIYSALVLHTAGKDITDEAITNILESASIEADAAKVKALTASLEGIDIDEAIATTAIAGAAPAAAADGEAPAADEEPKKKEEEEEEEEEVSEEEAAAGLGALFG